MPEKKRRMSMEQNSYSRIKQLLQEFETIAGPGAPLCLVITGNDLAIQALLRMPGVPARIEHMAIGKAYTCAKMGCTTAALHERLIREHLSLADFMDTRLTSMAGGVPLLDDKGKIIAGIGISGRVSTEDEEVALRVREFLMS
jgi:uncharacterized protein GlcG (DUF336 family)